MVLPKIKNSVIVYSFSWSFKSIYLSSVEHKITFLGEYPYYSFPFNESEWGLWLSSKKKKWKSSIKKNNTSSLYDFCAESEVS